MEYSSDYLSTVIESGLKELKYPEKAPHLFDPIKYTLEAGGKRLRPSLLLAVFAALSSEECIEALPQALAVEMFHNFTLLHDDLMDNADIRRGRPAVHRKWNSNVAILSGDTMLTLAVQLLSKCATANLPNVLKLFNDTAIEVYEGQQLDMEFERRSDVTVAEYLEMIKLKTSVLLACSCSMGAILANANDDVVNAFYEYGINLGLAFQLRDDWLDTFGDPAIFGKYIGGDIINRKKTWLLITGLTESEGELAKILAEDLSDDELVDKVREIYNQLDLNERCSALATKYSNKAIACLDAIKMDVRARNFFEKLAKKAVLRSN